MGWQPTPWADPLLLATVVSLSLALYAAVYVATVRRDRRVVAFFTLMFGTAVWSLGYSFQFASDDLAGKLLWHAVQVVGQTVAPVALLVFALTYAGLDRWVTRRRLALLAVVPLLTVTFAVTNGSDGLLWHSPTMAAPAGYEVLRLSPGPWLVVHATFSYLAVALGMAILIRLVARSRRLYRGQATALVAGVFVPVSANLANVSGLDPALVDLTPIAFAVSGMAFGLSIFRYRLLELVPVARDSVIESMQEGYALLDTTDRLIDVNPAGAALLGVDESRDLGRPMRELVPELAALFEGDASQAELELADGGLVRVTLSSLDVRDRGGRLLLVRAVGDARRVERRYQALIENATDVITVLDTDGTVRYESPSVRAVLGFRPETVEGQSVFSLIHPEDEADVREMFTDLAEGVADTVRVEARVRHADGTWRVLESVGRDLVSDPYVEGIVINSRDVTDRKRRERELVRTNERLDQFASLVSHDLRNPLNVAEGHLDIALETGAEDSLHIVREEHDRMRDIIEDVLALARDGKAVTDPVPVSIREVARAAWRNVDTDEARLVTDEDLTVPADRNRLLALFENLFRNSVDHGSPRPGSDGSDHGDTPLTVTVSLTGSGFAVADDGPGILDDARDEVFTSGYTTAESGTGFGLAIVRSIAEAHGWSVALAPDADGARFEFETVGGVNEE
ncbi:histidine kinase N-terminal 7TM domain-containing protein [Haloarchaeobius sp. HME9146]|uniref:histidine kinase N-terminal 7TM domain-containing protein n=1 Tax=Haloarchaeobius sp. HME9146 TaxID=2978732 RepID=UPI0021BF394D|nr:histidine kinase N-terminal 7TM domain-containing protein [Haloarchaeobius sp. HME9146]MCT9095242.1 PAS domain S-box protein [Haloarchaeobius sp. HME9146]